MPPAYGIQGPPAASFSPNANQFTPFANQFGNMAAAWPQVPPSMGLPYQYQDPTSNYSIVPATSGVNPTLNQQAAAFTPRTAINQGQGHRQGQSPGHGHSPNASSNGHSSNGEQDLISLEDQIHRFNMDQRHQ